MSDHGTRPRYQKGCRCKPCRQANADAMRAWRDRQPNAHTGAAPHARSGNAWEPTDGRLGVMCWCGQEIVKVLVEHVRAGTTYSCGQDHCRAPGA